MQTEKHVGIGLILMGLVCVVPSEAQWLRWTTGALPETAGAPLTVAIDPRDSRIIYAGTQSAGAHRSTDGGATWASFGLGLEEHTVFSLLVHPDDPVLIYAGTQTGLYHTLGPEPAWAKAPFSSVSVTWDLALSSQPPRRFYAALPRIGFNHFLEGTRIGEQVFGEEAGAVAVAIDPTDVSSVEIALGPSLLRSEDNGMTWCRIDRFESRILDVLLLPTGARLVATTDGVWHQASRETPRRKVFELPTWTLKTSPHVAGTVYLGLANGAGAEPGLWRSTDGGATWLPAARGLPTGRAILSIAFDPKLPQRLWAVVFEEGIYRSDDGGKTWARRWPGGAKPMGGDGSNRVWSEQGKETP